MMRRSLGASLLAAALFSTPSFTLANGGTITSGGASFTILPYSGATEATDFRPLGASGANYAPRVEWLYNGGFSSVSRVGIESESYAGNTATFTTNNGGTPGTMTFTLNATPTLVTLTSTFSFTNTGNNIPNARAYHYADLDAGGVTTNTATLVSPGLIRITDGTHPVDFAAANPSEYQVAAPGVLGPAIGNFGAPPLNNTGLPFGPGNFTGAYEWDFALIKNVVTTYSVTYTVAVPEPTTLFGAIALIPFARRRRGSAPG